MNVEAREPTVIELTVELHAEVWRDPRPIRKSLRDERSEIPGRASQLVEARFEVELGAGDIHAFLYTGALTLRKISGQL